MSYGRNPYYIWSDGRYLHFPFAKVPERMVNAFLYKILLKNLRQELAQRVYQGKQEWLHPFEFTESGRMKRVDLAKQAAENEESLATLKWMQEHEDEFVKELLRIGENEVNRGLILQSQTLQGLAAVALQYCDIDEIEGTVSVKETAPAWVGELFYLVNSGSADSSVYDKMLIYALQKLVLVGSNDPQVRNACTVNELRNVTWEFECPLSDGELAIWYAKNIHLVEQFVKDRGSSGSVINTLRQAAVWEQESIFWDVVQYLEDQLRVLKDKEG